MSKYPFEAYTRVALAVVADISAPTVAELNVSTDITYELVPEGLRLPRVTAAADATPWASRLNVERPTRYSMGGSSLTGFRYEPPDTEPLWDLSIFNLALWIVVRRGIDCDAPWEAGHEVEVTAFRFGKRSTHDTASDTLTTFTVPLFVTADDDDAVVVA